ncbi:hypothetical protein CUY_4882 [Bacteroides ovatus SD CMC 3f]|uniref:helix-turn-helix domain-containing protein n=1 Tax=Bacteroides ovatus TaxID=28116 RepID=UPI0001CED87A|nr:helix-turn-helix domain-containing protein [Bacteroides ovatus]EFF50396.1 hypothetical protein CUY_4882 [Bacteroides ovatus SD CMC 3f]
MNSNKSSYQGQIETILHYLNSMIQKNWTGKTADEFNRLISIPELAKMACMSVRNLQLMFKAYTSETLHQYIIRTRMEYAQQLLKDTKTRPIMDGFRKNNVNYWVFREIRSIIPHL